MALGLLLFAALVVLFNIHGLYAVVGRVLPTSKFFFMKAEFVSASLIMTTLTVGAVFMVAPLELSDRVLDYLLTIDVRYYAGWVLAVLMTLAIVLAYLSAIKPLPKAPHVFEWVCVVFVTYLLIIASTYLVVHAAQRFATLL